MCGFVGHKETNKSASINKNFHLIFEVDLVGVIR